MAEPYYYFSASLPILRFDEVPLISLERFVADARQLLKPKDSQFIEDILAMPETGVFNSFTKKLYKLNQDFRNNLTAFRARRASKDPADYVRGEEITDENLNTLIDQAAKKENLLEGEKSIDLIKWKLLDEMITYHYNDIIFLGVYALKLQILKRYEAINSPLGSELLEQYKEECMPTLA